MLPWHSRKEGIESDLGSSQLAETIHFPSSTGAERGGEGGSGVFIPAGRSRGGCFPGAAGQSERGNRGVACVDA